MNQARPIKFKGKIHIIGINPFVFLPVKVLNAIFRQAEKKMSPIQVKGTVNGQPYKQNLVKHLDEWRLYINTSMLKKSPERVGETIGITIEFDPDDRTIETPPGFTNALKTHKEASMAFEKLNKSGQKEIVKYLAKLKTKESLDRNIEKAINFLLGKEQWVFGRNNTKA